jgi:two-component system response regulator WspF
MTTTSQGEGLRVAIVNDSITAVEALRRAVSTAHEVAWVARNGAEAVALAASNPPDVLLMDLIMPGIGGAEATRQIMASAPCPILVVTATVSGNFNQVYEAMAVGALDAVNTPVLGAAGDLAGAEELLAKIATVGRLIHRGGTAPLPPVVPASRLATDSPVLVAIGASTGGPQALIHVLSALPKHVAVVIIQHVDPGFAPGMAVWLTERSGFPCVLAREGAALQAGVAMLAATADHLVLIDDARLHYTPHPREYRYRPSVDAFFRSVVERWEGDAIGVLLTGMGRDGAEGLLAMRRAGHATLAQDQKSCVVYGMPRAAVELKAADRVLPVTELGAVVKRLAGELVTRRRARSQPP